MRLAVVAWAAAVLLAAAQNRAGATIDMTGIWTFSDSAPFGSGTFSIQQAGTLVTLCPPPPVTGSIHGTIDPDTGALTFTFPPDIPISVPGGYACNFTWTGTVSPDGSSLVANEHYGYYCIPPPFTCGPECLDEADHAASAIRTSTTATSCACGNGIVDPGEVCDPGLPSTCCAIDCSSAAPGGTSCASDGNVCTDDVCDGAGACTHVANTSACGTACQAGTCSGGSCDLGPPAPAGASCPDDGSHCTAGTCDGAGQCVVQYVCDACTICNPGIGCEAIPPTSTCLQTMDHGLLDFRLGKTPDENVVEWRYEGDAFPFGDPTATTSYHLCVITDSGGGFSNILFELTAPPGGTCPRGPCWSSDASGIAYRDRSAGADGLRAIRGRSTGRWKVSARGDVPVSIPLFPTDNVSAAIVAYDPATPFFGCWGGKFPNATIRNARRFRAKR